MASKSYMEQGLYGGDGWLKTSFLGLTASFLGLTASFLGLTTSLLFCSCVCNFLGVK